MDYNDVLKKVPAHVISLFTKQHIPDLFFHDADYIFFVVDAAKKIGKEEKLNDNGQFVIELAAWFYDSGAAIKKDNYERESANFANAFLRQEQVDEHLVAEISSLITTTRGSQKSGGFLERIIYDASTFYLGDKTFDNRNKALRKQTVALLQQAISEKEWIETTIKFMEEHKYFTSHARSTCEEGKARNLEILRNRLNRLK